MTGPDELRELADRLLTGGSNYLPLRNRLYALADAWEADVSDVCTINAELNGTIIRLSKRLEKLTEAARNTYCRNCDGANGCMDCATRTVHDECEKNCPVCCGEDAEVVGLWELHALAGEEKP